MKIFYFTATGNSLYVAKAFDGEVYSIPKMLKENRLKFEDEKIGFVIPAYYMGAPRIVKEFLEKVELKSDYIFAIMTYGNSAGAGVTHFSKLAAKENIDVSYADEILMVDNYLPLFDIDDQIQKIASKNIEANLNQIVNNVNASKRDHVKKNTIERVLSFVAQGYYSNRKSNVDEKFIVNDNCTSCKTCEKVCPVNNIVVKGKPKYNHRCDECLACINLCPVNAIKLKKEKGTARYKNSKIELQEIIESNR